LYTLAGVSTGGFAPRDSSIGALTYSQQIAVQGISALGAFALASWYYLVTGARRRMAFFNEEFWTYLFLLLTVFAALYAILRAQLGTGTSSALEQASILALSAQSTTGYTSLNVQALSSSAKVVLIGSMLVGGQFGSTAGGFKLIRLVIVIKTLSLVIRRIAAPPEAVLDARVNGRVVSTESIIDAAVVGTLFIATCFLLWIPLVVHGAPPLDALFDAASALGTVGLSTGVTAPGLPAGLKLMLCAGMLLGRLEILAWIVLFSPRSWMGQRKEAV
jgi:trk system potassium uptake protein TrkH